MRSFARTPCLVALATTLLRLPAAAQSVVERPPNVSGGWVGTPGTLYFNFLHRFSETTPPQHKVSNAPTFLMAAGLPGGVLAGAHYATNSDVVAQYPNEWEFFARWRPLAQERGAPLDAGVQAGYNLAARSLDAELSLGRWLGPLRLLVAGRVLSAGYDAGERRLAAAGGAALRLARWLTLAGDVASLVDAEAREETAWSAGLQVGIPYTPHSLSLQATNTNTGTLQGASRGSDRVLYGFEFTIPLTLSRYLGRPSAGAAPPPSAPDTVPRLAPSDTSGWIPATDTIPAPAEVRAGIRDLRFVPDRIEVRAGTTVVWTNQDQVPHTVTADGGSFDSGIIAPGGTWRHTFREPGTFPFHCTPHPFMKGTIVVR